MIASDDLPRLKWAISAVVVAVALVAAAFWHLDRQRREALAELDRTQRAYRSAHARYVNAQRDENQVRHLIARFEAFRGRGLVGPEARLDWVERVRRARETSGLQRLEFELRPRRPLRTSDARYRLTASTMSLHGSLPHEGHLLAFLERIFEESTALTRVRRCTLDRLAATTQEDKLDFACEIDWITVEPPQERTP
ncbi:MAG: hypothetical protein KDG52_07705 [Rhodocyclaceae bacterium]|nr:hypothetical protein [Rhodocyclaceae bacterium]